MDWTNLREQYLFKQHDVPPPKLEIPALPDVVYRVAQETQSPNVTADKLGKIIESDVALTSDLLKYVNSSAMGLQHKASAASRAVNLLGIKKTKLFVLTVASNRLARAVTTPLILMKRFSASSYERALFAKYLAGKMNLDQDLAYSASLLQDMALPTLTSQKIDTYIEMTNESVHASAPLAVQEKKVMGWNHAEVAANVMLSWGFPDELICCVFFHHEFEKIISDPELKKTELLPVACSGLLDDLLHQSPNGYELLLKSWDNLFLNVSIIDVAMTVQEQLLEMTPKLHGHITLAENLQTIGV